MAAIEQALLIAGPTASGKTALAVALARRHGAVIVNADSMQVYRDLSILSARPSAVEQEGVPHHLFGTVDGGTEFSVGAWLAAVAALGLAGRVIFVGGTGLYFKALTEGLVAAPGVPQAIREALAARAAAGEDLHAALAAVDPETAARLAPGDAPRIERALGLYQATGETLSQQRRRAQGKPFLPPGCWQGLFLAPARETLYRRIDARFTAMVEAGALDEVRALARRGLPANRGVMKAHGVPHLVAHLAGELPLEEAIRRGQADTRHYARRQFTWARRFMAGWQWLETAPRPEDVTGAWAPGAARP